jgi:hypothetical protein
MTPKIVPCKHGHAMYGLEMMYGRWSVHCWECDPQGPDPRGRPRTVDEAIRVWNERQKEPRP